jgi:Reverse transcriptase (RNA-dependent DNA polymerase)
MLRTRNSFSSGSFPADMGVGQGLALSPVLSALYIAPVLKIFAGLEIGRKVDLMSYVDDGTFITQSVRLEDNLPLLTEAYGVIFRAFTSLGLVLEHDKSEVFHFSQARRFSSPPIDLGFAPYTRATPLHPKPIWRYLGFFFDRKLLFKEHVRFYSTKAFTTVKAMGMLGNSNRGVTLAQKHLLYRSCVVPVFTYGARLWHFWGSWIQGHLKALGQVQLSAARWITGCFCTTPIGGMESQAGLLLGRLLLKHLCGRGALRAPLLSPSHPLRAILGLGLRGSAQRHPLGLVPSGALSALRLKGPSGDTADACTDICADKFEPFGPESQPGLRMEDLYASHITRH